MARYENERYENRTVLIDGHQFVNCHFETCTIEYRATAQPQMNGCHFAGCRWSFQGAAANTIRFLTALYANNDPVLQGMVNQTLDNIKRNHEQALSEDEMRPVAMPTRP